jgi:hypothetical protein
MYLTSFSGIELFQIQTVQNLRKTCINTVEMGMGILYI